MSVNQRWLTKLLYSVKHINRCIAKPAVSLILILAILLMQVSFPVAKVEAQEFEVSPMVSAGSERSLALKSDGSVWNWGYQAIYNYYQYTWQSTPYPTEVIGLAEIVELDYGYNHFLALDSDRTVWAWGRNLLGQLGDGTTERRYIPVKVIGLSDIVAVSAGNHHSLALKSDGTVWAWGGNYCGQLGNGTGGENTSDWDDYSSLPVQVIGLTDVKAVSAGYNHSLALKKDGTVWAWGENGRYQLGDGTGGRFGDYSNVPVQVKNLTNVQDLSGGSFHSLALKLDGSVWAWGDGRYGQVGDGTARTRPTPVQVKGLTDVKAVSCGHYHSLALKSDGTAWAWGSNKHGNLGDGTTVSKTIPVQVNNLTDVVVLAGGRLHSMAMKEDGTVWAWGSGNHGELGDGTTENRHTPVQSLINLGAFEPPPDEDRDTLVRLAIQRERIQEADIFVTVDGTQYIIATLQNKIDTDTLETVVGSGIYRVYLDLEGNPVSDGSIAQKIGLIETARSIDIDFSKRKIKLEAINLALDSLSLSAFVYGTANLIYSGVKELSTLKEAYDFFKADDFWDAVLTDWEKLSIAANVEPPTGLIVKAATWCLERLVGNPIKEAHEDLDYHISQATTHFEKAADINNQQINDNLSAFLYLRDVYNGRTYEEVSSYLAKNALFNLEVILYKFAPLPGIYSLFKFATMVREAHMALNWTLDTGAIRIMGTYKAVADLLYFLSDGARYTLKLASAEEEILYYNIKYIEEENKGYQAVADAADAVYDYLAGFDINELLRQIRYIILNSPGELRAYDSQGRVTGLVSGEVKEQIPNSIYSLEDKALIIFDALDVYKYVIEGTDEGIYDLKMYSLDAELEMELGVSGSNITNNSIHQYKIDWEALAQGEPGITIQKDADGSGVFEETIVTGLPHVPSNPLPADQAIDVSPITQLEWQAGDSDPDKELTYEIYFGKDEAPELMDTIGPYSAEQEELTFDPGDLELNTTYYWRVVARDNHGLTVQSPLWVFTTEGDTDDGVQLPPELDNMMIIGGIGVSIDLLFDNNELAREKINAALDVDGVSFEEIIINFTTADQLFWLVGRQAPTAGEIASIIDKITGYWDAGGTWVDW